MIDRLSIITIVASWLVNITCAALVYKMNDPGDGTLFTVTLEDDCSYYEPFPGKRRNCILNNPVLQPFIDAGGEGVFMVIARAAEGRPHDLCEMQGIVCSAVEANYDYDDDCTKVFGNCRSALRHLHEMMFNKPPSKQICNNFARKSIRGFFHDFMSNAIDGSILGEHDVSMNFGLCRWTQYINVLSDQTSCDPGSIIAMAGELGYLACGVDLWNVDIAVKPKVTLNRPFSCGSNIDESPLFNGLTKQRKEEFSDAQLASNATAMEEFWYAANGHFNGRGDGEVEYSAEATAAAHAIGRVTCPPDGVTDTGNPASYKKGFFHKPHNLGNDQLWWATPNTKDVNREYQQGIDKISAKQCAYSKNDDPIPQPEGIRPETKSGETDFNSEGGFCGMPTQFLGTVKVGGLHRVPRWTDSVEHVALSWPDWSPYQSGCRETHGMYIPLELLTISDVDLPQSASLTRFKNIAWDGYDSINSEWDSCVVGCAVPVLENNLCGGKNGLSEYDWRQGYCHNGTPDAGETVCCQDDCSKCTVGADGGVCEVDEGGPECISALAVGCVIPRKGDGSVCNAGIDCKSSTCKGKCCNIGGVVNECVACGPFGGHCTACAEGFKLVGTKCVDECSCSEGCIDCECGTCHACDPATHFLSTDSKCQRKRGKGMICDNSKECVSGGCLGGYCCMESVIAECEKCNTRGKCAACKGEYTLCGHHLEDEGFCKLTISKKLTAFQCGTGGVETDYPSSDGYNYCAMATYCPCSKAGCYFGCEIEETCWIGSIADSLTDYEPIYTSLPTTLPTSTPSSIVPCSQDQNDRFYYKTTKKKGPIFKTCKWLEIRKLGMQKNICQKKVNHLDGYGPAEITCLKTCNSCDKCHENENSKFYLKTNKNGIVRTKNCKWLVNQSHRNKLCKKTSSSETILAAQYVCPKTCETIPCAQHEV